MSSFLAFNMEQYYSLSPRIFKVKTETEIRFTSRFAAGKLPDTCIVRIIPVAQFKNLSPFDDIEVCVEEDSFTFTYSFSYEQQYLIRLIDTSKQSLHIEFAVYALEEDLFACTPWKGDLHLHSTRSDGAETPQHLLCACREHGLDFMAICDHNRYDASLEAIEGLDAIPHRMVALRGEEVHAGADAAWEARCPVHILSLDADYAIAPFKSFDTDAEFEATLKAMDEDFEKNAREKPWLQAMGKDRAKEILKATQLRREALLREFDDPTNTIDARGYVFALDVFEEIRKAGGFSALCHTQWRFIPFDDFKKRDDVPLEFTRKLIREKPYDLYEAVSYAPKEESSRNLMQVRLLAEADHLQDTPLIGITDTHTTLPGWNELGRLYTVVFAKEFSTAGIREAIFDNRCVAVENYPNEDARCHGSYRLAVFTEFLIDHYFVFHDKHCTFEASLMYRYFEKGDDSAVEMLAEICSVNQKEEDAWWAR